MYELRSRGVPVGTQEVLALARALEAGLHESSLDGFYHGARSVMTLSYDQVDRPIYRTSVERWRRYEAHLGPLREALDAGR